MIAETWQRNPQDNVTIAGDHKAMPLMPASRHQHSGNPRHPSTKQSPASRLRNEKVLPRRCGVASSAILRHARVVEGLPRDAQPGPEKVILQSRSALLHLNQDVLGQRRIRGVSPRGGFKGRTAASPCEPVYNESFEYSGIRGKRSR